MGKRITSEEFLAKLYEVHGDDIIAIDEYTQ